MVQLSVRRWRRPPPMHYRQPLFKRDGRPVGRPPTPLPIALGQCVWRRNGRPNPSWPWQPPWSSRAAAGDGSTGAQAQQQQEQEQQQVGHEVVPPGASTTLSTGEQVAPWCLLKRSIVIPPIVDQSLVDAEPGTRPLARPVPEPAHIAQEQSYHFEAAPTTPFCDPGRRGGCWRTVVDVSGRTDWTSTTFSVSLSACSVATIVSMAPATTP